MFLSDKTIRNAKPKDKIYRLKDGDGLFLQVEPNGGKYWRLRYFFLGKEKMLAIGTYPEVSLSEARNKRLAARRLVSSGEDPGVKKKEEKRLAVFKAGNTFRAVAKEWLDTNKPKWVPEHAERIWRRLELHLLPEIGDRPIAEISPLELLDAIRKVEKSGTTETAHRLLQTCNVIFRYSVITMRREYNPAGDLRGVLTPHKTKNLPTIQAKELPKFFEALEEVKTSPQNKIALRFTMLTFVRQGELRYAKWSDIDFKAKEWRIRPETTKMKELHIVPLSKQALKLLEELREYTGYSEYLFPSQQRRRHAVMSENTVNSIIEAMGYKGKIVAHGFRSLASTTLNEMGHFREDAIERQLAHMERNKVRAAYNRAEYLPERREMMQWWADYLSACERGEKFETKSDRVITLRSLR